VARDGRPAVGSGCVAHAGAHGAHRRHRTGCARLEHCARRPARCSPRRRGTRDSRGPARRPHIYRPGPTCARASGHRPPRASVPAAVAHRRRRAQPAGFRRRSRRAPRAATRKSGHARRAQGEGVRALSRSAGRREHVYRLVRARSFHRRSGRAVLHASLRGHAVGHRHARTQRNMGRPDTDPRPGRLTRRRATVGRGRSPVAPLLREHLQSRAAQPEGDACRDARAFLEASARSAGSPSTDARSRRTRTCHGRTGAAALA
ncbi:MAG: Domain often clustered or fused with uracil-DNA glycosylase / Uracil-DNA glycosylase, putative family 6, partial [uncultured Lysobacter sp.]